MDWKCRVLGHDKMTMTQGDSLIDLGCKRCGHKSMDTHAIHRDSQLSWNSGFNNNRDISEHLFYMGYSSNTTEQPVNRQ
jgi:hypothetical protein